MPSADESLDALRREIDAIDDAMHDLLLRRAALGDRVRAAKSDNGSLVYHPGREALIIRRLLRRHSGPLPPRFVAGLWREIIAATIRLQAPFKVAVVAPKGANGCERLAHDHFGALTPLLPFPAPGPVLAAVSDGLALVGVVPLPDDDDGDPWWRHLAGERPNPLRILARLPFAPSGEGGEALVIGCQPFEPTGEDRGYLLVEIAGDASRARLTAALEAVGLRPISFAAGVAKNLPPGAPRQQLIEVDPYCGDESPALAALVAKLGEGALGAQSLGGYAVPLPPPSTAA